MSKLLDALRKKFKTPKEALDALGLDDAVLTDGDTVPQIAGDSKEKTMTTVKLSPSALVAIGAMQQYLGTRLAMDSRIDLKPIFGGITAKNFAAQKPYIIAKIRAAVNGNIATDADVEDLPEMLDQIEALAGEASEAVGGEVGPDPAEDPTKTPDAVGDPDADPMAAGGDPDPAAGGEDPMASGESDSNEIEDFLRDKLDPADFDTVCAMMQASKAGGAIDTNKEPMMDAKAMDAAIRKAVKVAVDAAEQRHAAVVDATRIVRPYVGELNVAFDSAEEVYRHTLDALGVPTKGVHRDALPAILAAQPKPGARRDREPRVAQDAATAKGYHDRFPSAARIGHM